MSNHRVTRTVRRDEHTYVVVPEGLYDDRGPADRLLDHIEERELAPFSYEELKRRQYAVDDEQLAATFGNLVRNDRIAPATMEEGSGFAVAERKALANLRRHLNTEYGWGETRYTLPDAEEMDVIADEADGYNTVMHFRLTQNGAFRTLGAYTFFTDAAWDAIYEHTGETVWDLARDDAGTD